MLREPKQPVLEITKKDGKPAFPDKLKVKPTLAYLYYGENMKETGEGLKADLERPTRFEMKASIGSGIFPILAELLEAPAK